MHVDTLAVSVALLLAVALGVLSGFFTSRFSIPSFMVTLALMQIAAGLTIKISQGKPYFPPAFTVPSFLRTLGTGEVFGAVPILPIVAGVVLLAGHLVLTYTRFGRYVYMTGGNREAAELAGVRTCRVVLACLTLSAFTGAVAGLLLVGRIGSADAHLEQGQRGRFWTRARHRALG